MRDEAQQRLYASVRSDDRPHPYGQASARSREGSATQLKQENIHE